MIRHRVNTVEECRQLSPTIGGIELDIRASERFLVCSHDPYVRGDSLSDLLCSLPSNRFVICNIKDSGIEEDVSKVFEASGDNSHVFLDSTMSEIQKLIRAGKRNFFARLSFLEPIEMAKRMSDYADWLWVDPLAGCLPNIAALEVLQKDYGLRLCLASPEIMPDLSGSRLEEISQLLDNDAFAFDAVCTKEPEKWIRG